MLFSRGKRSIRGLLLSWVAYWVLLFGVKLGPAIFAIWHATRGPDNGKNTVSFNFSNTALSLSVIEQGMTTWSGSVTPVALALWIGIVPMLLWFVWARSRPAQRTVIEEVGQRV